MTANGIIDNRKPPRAFYIYSLQVGYVWKPYKATS